MDEARHRVYVLLVLAKITKESLSEEDLFIHYIVSYNMISYDITWHNIRCFPTYLFKRQT